MQQPNWNKVQLGTTMDTYRLRKITIATVITAMITVTIMSNPITSPGTLKGKSTHARTLNFGHN